MTATGRSVLDLPIDDGWTFVADWQKQVHDLREFAGIRELPLRLMLDTAATEPILPEPLPGVKVSVERDPKPFRGTGGLLRDIADQYDDDAYLVVANAAQVLLQPLPELTWTMAATGGDICAVSHLDGVPSGLMFVQCRCLRKIPEIGFVDLKEQALPMISKNHRASVVYREVPSGLPVRSLEGYIRALSCYHKSRVGKSFMDPFGEDWETSFSIVEPGAEVAEGARLHDSVVLRGGRVERDAFVAKSIVCGDGIVTRRKTVVDELIRA
ncbi:MAG: hypothetical protein AAF517_28450 [Planctomycetota bacterium]